MPDRDDRERARRARPSSDLRLEDAERRRWRRASPRRARPSGSAGRPSSRKKSPGPRSRCRGRGGTSSRQHVHRRRVPGRAPAPPAPASPPSIQSESMLATKIGVVAQQRPRLLDAAAGIQQPGALVGDQRSRGRCAAARCASSWSAKWWTLTTARSTPASTSRSSTWSISGSPADLDQGLGPVVGQRPHAGAEARGQHHRGRRAGAHARASAGTWRSNQAFRPRQLRVGQAAVEVAPECAA